jgi:hypothetical protein
MPWSTARFRSPVAECSWSTARCLTPEVLLDREGLLRVFKALDQELGRDKTRADVFVVGGAAMAVAFDTRRSTRDVDAIFAPTAEVRAAARRVAERLHLDADWLNDAAKAIVPGDDPNKTNVFEGKYLQVAAASPRFLLAMKLLASRVERDQDDIRELYRLCGFTTAEEGACPFQPTIFAPSAREYAPKRRRPASSR